MEKKAYNDCYTLVALAVKHLTILQKSYSIPSKRESIWISKQFLELIIYHGKTRVDIVIFHLIVNIVINILLTVDIIPISVHCITDRGLFERLDDYLLWNVQFHFFLTRSTIMKIY